jgi:hypothetical protein
MVGNSEVTVHFLGLRKIADELIYGTPQLIIELSDTRAFGAFCNTKMAK